MDRFENYYDCSLDNSYNQSAFENDVAGFEMDVHARIGDFDNALMLQQEQKRIESKDDVVKTQRMAVPQRMKRPCDEFQTFFSYQLPIGAAPQACSAEVLDYVYVWNTHLFFEREG